jgi:hypothetical protein
MGALEVDKVVHEHEGWRLVSCIWLHGGAIHVLANMLSLLFIGIRLEQEFGFGMVLVIILALFKYIVIFLLTNSIPLSVFISLFLHKCSGRKETQLSLFSNEINKKALLSIVISTFLVLSQLELDFSM